MPRKTIYFHIGTHKTGTTALQKFFMENESILARKGFLYKFYNQEEMNHGHLIKSENWEGIVFNKNKNYIISGEDFYHNILLISDTIKNKLNGFNIRFIVYLKRQDLMKQSVYNQIVKMHGFHKQIQEDSHYNLNYYQFLNNLKNLFKRESITVRAYENGQFEGGSIYSDFLNILGLELDTSYHIEKSVVNPSLTRDKLELCRLINMLGLTDGLRAQINSLVVKIALESKETKIFREQNLLSPQESIELLVNHTDSNKKIAKEYMGRENGTLFYDANPDISTHWIPYPGLRKSDATKIVKCMATKNTRLLKELYNEVNSSNQNTQGFIRASNFLMPIFSEFLNQKKRYKPSERGVDIHPSKKIFSALMKNLNEKPEIADILREVALEFERSGDITTATKIMEQAHIQRPKGPYIKRKLEEYHGEIFANIE
jgi:hypothetical protein